MSRVVLRPRRRLRYELYMLALVFLVPAALVAVFPYEAIGFTPASGDGVSESSCAFVTLSDEEADLALDESRAYWKVDSRGARGMRLDLSESDVLEDVAESVLAISERRRLPPAPPLGTATPPLPPTLASAPAARLRGAERPDPGPSAAFARAELLDTSEFDLKGN